ncbi:MAG TPA: zinc-dependent peptidase, partial [Acidimicrobiia bacterium]|nr:zinc-dependent peptidase [Acidimicrobiia bacterium]
MTTFGRGRRRRAGLPAGWERVTESTLAQWAGLDDSERARLVEFMDLLLRHKRWEAAAGFELTEGMRVLIAGHAAVLILGLDFDWYRDVQAIIVHPSTITFTDVRPGPVQGVVTDSPMLISGQANDRRGPVLIAWDAALLDARFPHRGQDVVFHEFAHKLDLLDGTLDGTPPLRDAA